MATLNCLYARLASRKEDREKATLAISPTVRNPLINYGPTRADSGSNPTAGNTYHGRIKPKRDIIPPRLISSGLGTGQRMRNQRNTNKATARFVTEPARLVQAKTMLPS
jgi:hypothetical protein